MPDVEDEIVAALDALRHRYTYVFTTGGIGPTHDDITADCVAKAFGVSIDVDPRARALLLTRIAEKDLNEARLRMARIPAGADLILNKVSARAGLPHRQRACDGGRAVDHAGDARRGGADAQDRRQDAVGDGARRTAARATSARRSARSPRRIPT